MARDNNSHSKDPDLDMYILKNRRFKSFVYKKQHACPKQSCGGNVERVLQETIFKRRNVEIKE